MVEYDDDVSPFLKDRKSIKVDVTELDRFAGTVSAEVDGNFRPMTDRLFNVYKLGTTFGHDSPSDAVHQAQLQHHAALDATGRNIAAYINAAQALITAIKRIQDDYSTADAMSGSRGDEVSAILNGAAKEANARLQAEIATQEALDRQYRAMYGGGGGGTPV